MFNVKILGCNGLFPSDGNNTSGYLVKDGKTTILCDVGSGVFAQLKNTMPPENVSAIFISHLHFDHISDLGVYNYYLERLTLKGQFSGKIKLIIKSDESAVYQSIQGLSYFEIINFNEESNIKINNLSLSFKKMNHPSLCHSITIDNGSEILTYLGDTNFNENLENLFKISDGIICHAPFLVEEWSEKKAHLCLKKAVELAKKYNTFAICSHFLPESNMEKLKEEAESVYNTDEKRNYVFAVQNENYIINKK